MFIPILLDAHPLFYPVQTSPLVALRSRSQIRNFTVYCLHEEVTPVQTTVKILKIGTPEIITIIVLQLEQLDFTLQYCVQKMQTE